MNCLRQGWILLHSMCTSLMLPAHTSHKHLMQDSYQPVQDPDSSNEHSPHAPQHTSCTGVASRGTLQLAELPAEVLLLVLAQLALTDVSHVACSCARLHSLLLEEDLWSRFVAEPEPPSSAAATPGQATQGLPAVQTNATFCAELPAAAGPAVGSLEASSSSGEQLRAITDADGRKRYVKASAAEDLAAPAACQGSAVQFPQLRGLLRSHLRMRHDAPELLPGAGWLLAKTLTRAGRGCSALAALIQVA